MNRIHLPVMRETPFPCVCNMELESEPHSCAHVNVCVITVINISCWLLTFFFKYFIYIFIYMFIYILFIGAANAPGLHWF